MKKREIPIVLLAIIFSCVITFASSTASAESSESSSSEVSSAATAEASSSVASDSSAADSSASESSSSSSSEGSSESESDESGSEEGSSESNSDEVSSEGSESGAEEGSEGSGSSFEAIADEIPEIIEDALEALEENLSSSIEDGMSDSIESTESDSASDSADSSASESSESGSSESTSTSTSATSTESGDESASSSNVEGCSNPETSVDGKSDEAPNTESFRDWENALSGGKANGAGEDASATATDGTAGADGAAELGAKATEPKDGKVTTKRSNLNVRTGAWGEIIGKLPKGTDVKIVGREGDWYKIQYNGKEAYVHSKYINNGKDVMATGTTSTGTAGTDGTSATDATGTKGTTDSTGTTNTTGTTGTTGTADTNGTTGTTTTDTGATGTTGTSGTTNTTGATSNGPQDESFKKGLDYSNIISDSAFTDKNSMSAQEIQSFLEKKGSILSKEYNGQMPSQLIYDTAQKYGISPKVLLTRLQVEKSLISKGSASKNTLDWALGVGCYDNGTKISKYKGFENQIAGAAQTYVKWFNDGQNKGGSVTQSIDGRKLTSKNAATYSTYKYTPHYGGAKLFRDVYMGYFK
jgi:trimeric autotransporter adhesin